MNKFKVAVFALLAMFVFTGCSLKKNDNDLINFVSQNLDKLDKVIKATFGVSELEMECIDTMELGTVGVEIYKWAIDKISSLRAGDYSKNA